MELCGRQSGRGEDEAPPPLRLRQPHRLPSTLNPPVGHAAKLRGVRKVVSKRQRAGVQRGAAAAEGLHGGCRQRGQRQVVAAARRVGGDERLAGAHRRRRVVEAPEGGQVLFVWGGGGTQMRRTVTRAE